MSAERRNRAVYVAESKRGLADAIKETLKGSGLLDLVSVKASRIALKPNLTYPFYKQGVTTSPQFIREVVKLLVAYTPHVAIVESDGGYGAWSADEAFAGHQLYSLGEEFGIEIVNLCNEERELITFKSGWRQYQLPLPKRLLHETDLFITLPVPKIHCMTGLTLSYKNQWGCIPDPMRLRRHFIFDDAIVAINKKLKPYVLADGTFFLDRNGPMEGVPVRMDLVIAATDAGAFDLYTSELMGYSWTKVSHLRRAVELGDMPATLEDISFNVPPVEVSGHRFKLKRTLRNGIALTGFKSRFITWFGYESWFGRVVLHAILYAIAGKPVKPQPQETPDGARL